MKKILRYSLRAVVIAVAALVVLWIALLLYVNYNQQELIEKITTAARKRTHADVKIDDLSVSLFRTFPILSLQLSGVTAKDTLFHRHRHDFLSAQDLYLQLNPFSYAMGGSLLKKIIARNGSLYIYRDSSGAGNQYIFSGSDTGAKESSIPNLELLNMQLTYENPQRFKLFTSDVRQLKASFKNKDGSTLIKIKTDMLWRNLSFNSKRGGYMQNKTMKGELSVQFVQHEKQLLLKRSAVLLDDRPFVLEAAMKVLSDDYHVSIEAKRIYFSQAVAMLPVRLQKKLNVYSLKKPVAFNVSIEGKTSAGVEPLVKATMSVNNDFITSPIGNFSNCSLHASYTNQSDSSKERTDENSQLLFRSVSGKWEDIPFRSRFVSIKNLISPFLECALLADLDLRSLNDLSGSNTLRFTGGTANINVIFRGPINGRDSVKSSVDGAINLNNASLSYLPRNFTLKQCSGALEFKGKDLFVRSFRATAGKTDLAMNAEARNFLALIDVSPEKLLINWNISSPTIFLADFKPFLSKSAIQKSKGSKAIFSSTATKIDKMFTDGDVHINFETPRVQYKKFTATQVKADVLLSPTVISVSQAALRHAGGSVSLHATMQDAGSINLVSMRTSLQGISLPAIFESFNNFGQDALTDKNLKGLLTATINLNTAVTNDADMVREKTSGTVDFLVENGELNHFEPIQKVSETALKKQDFSEIRFADLKNRLEVNGTAFIVNKMEIRSTAFTMFVEGVYDVKKGTDMSIQLPLRNLTKNQSNTDLSEAGKKGAGISVRLRAKTGDDGKLKISWDPFKRAVKNKKEVVDSTNAAKQGFQ